jgi:hypothetical protein
MVVRRISLYAAAAVTAAVLMTFLFLEPILNSVFVKPWIVNHIETQVNTKIDPNQVTFLLTPQPGIQINTVTLPLTREIELSVDAVHLDLDLGALLKRKIEISGIFLKNLGIQTLPGENRTGLTFHAPLDFQFPKQQIQQIFALLPDSENQLQIHLENTGTQQFSVLNGSLLISKTDETMQFDTQIQDLHVTKDWLARFFSAPDFLMDQLASDTARLHVRLNPDTGISGNLWLDRFDIASHRLTPASISGSQVQMHFSYLPDQVSFHIDPTQLEYPFAQVGMAFSNSRTRNETALTFTGHHIDIAQAREATLALAPENQVVKPLFDILRKGTANDVSLGFHATSWDTLFDPRHLVLEASARNSQIKIPNTLLMADDVEGKAQVSDGNLIIAAENGSIDQSNIYQGRLTIDLLHSSHVPFTGEFDLDVNLTEVPAVLIRLLPDSKLAKEMARVKDLKGQADARLTLAVENDQPDLLVSVTTKPFSATGFYDRIPFPLTISQGEFVYENDQIRISGLSGNIGKSRVTDATARVILDETPLLDLSAKSLDLDIQEIWPKLSSWKPVRSRLEPVTDMSGQLIVSRLHYKGPMFEFNQGEFNIAGTGQDIRIGISSRPHEIHHMSGAFDVSENAIDISDLSAQITGLDWLSQQVSPAYTAGIALPLWIKSGSIQMHDKQMSVSGKAELAPNIEFSIQLTGKGPADLAPEQIALEHKPLTDAVMWFTRNPEFTQARFKGHLDSRTLDIVLDQQTLVQQRLASLTRGHPLEIVSDQAEDLHINTRFVQLDTLIALLDDPFLFDTSFQFPQKNLHIQADRLAYKTVEFSNVTAQITKDRQQLEIHLRTADCCGVDVSGQMMLDLKTPDLTAVTDLGITSTNQENIATLLSCFYPGLKLMDGKYALTANLSGTGPVKTFYTDLTGDILFESEKGQIHKMTLLSRLLSVLNILKLPDIRQEGFRYRNILVDAQMKNGTIHLDKAVIDAENMALFFTGEIHPFENRMDLTCLVAPFKTIDTLVQFIPVVNTILSGRLVSFPAKATGAIDDPVITPLHPSAVGEGLINMFTSLLTSPIRLFERTP